MMNKSNNNDARFLPPSFFVIQVKKMVNNDGISLMADHNVINNNNSKDDNDYDVNEC